MFLLLPYTYIFHVLPLLPKMNFQSLTSFHQKQKGNYYKHFKMFHLKSCSIKFLSIFIILFELSQRVVPYTVEMEDLELKLNRIIESEAQEKNFLKKLNSGKSSEIMDGLIETSHRMEWLVGLLVDLKTLLSQAVESHQKQMDLREEVGELREEIKYLRDEIQELKSEQTNSENFQLNTKVQSKIENDEKKIEWLTVGFEELRHEVRELSSTLNMTTIFHMNQQAENEAKETKRNIQTFQKDLEKIQVITAQTQEDVIELRGDMADIRRNQASISRNIIQEDEFSQDQFREIKSTNHRSRSRHEKKKIRRTELMTLENKVEELLASRTEFDNRIKGLEIFQESNKRLTLSNDIENKKDLTLDSLSSQLENVKIELKGIEPLQESTQTLFKVLEGLELKYDNRMNEFQTTQSRLDASVNDLSLSSDGIKDQLSSQWKTIRKLKTQIGKSESRQETVQLRLAVLQTQILKWGMKTCADETKEKAQDLKIASLEESMRNI